MALSQFKISLTLCFLSLSILFSSKNLFSQEISGFLRNYNAVLTSDQNQYLVGRNRFNLDFTYNTDFGRVFISNEVLNTYTRSANEYVYDFAEGYVDIYFDNSDLRIGKQIISQGRTNGTFITDIISPVDLSQFLTISVEDLKGGIPAIKYNRYFGSNFLELVATPIFQSNILAQPGSRWFPFTEIEEQVSVTYTDSLRENSFNSFQGIIKWGIRENLKWDLDLLAMWWTDGNPSYQKTLTLVGFPPFQIPVVQLTKTYLKTPILGYSGNYIINDNLILKSESAFHFKKYFDYLPSTLRNNDFNNLTPLQQQNLLTEFGANEDGFLLEKNWLVSMIGVQTSLAGIDVSSQLFYERIFDHETRLLQKQDFYYSTLSLQKSLMRNNLTLYSFGRYNYVGNDFWINPEATYNIRDGLETSIGFHFFAGESTEDFYGHFSFKNYANSSFGYITLTAFF